MLWQRILTALVLIPLALWLVLFTESAVFSHALMVVVMLAAVEWAMLCGLSRPWRWTFALGLLLVMLGMAYFNQPVDPLWLLGVAAVFWIYQSISLVRQREPVNVIQTIDWFGLVLGAPLLLVAWLAVSRLHAIDTHGPQLVMALLLLIWIADSAAYFSGRALGRRKLSPMVSPGKSWEGVAGAMLAVALYALLLGYHPFFAQANMLLLVGLSLLVTWVSIGGDLFESRIKRQRGVKDSGSLLPGHGGVYDRIDSLIAAAPVFLLGIMLLAGELGG